MNELELVAGIDRTKFWDTRLGKMGVGRLPCRFIVLNVCSASSDISVLVAYVAQSLVIRVT
jgi:hypothetical protein